MNPTGKPSPVTLISGYRGLAETFLNVFSEKKYRLSVLVRNSEAIPALRARFPDALFTVGDVKSHEICEEWVRSSYEHFGQIDLLINNAAITGPGGRLHEIAISEMEDTLRVNLLSPILLTQLVLPHFQRQNSGVVINLSGGGATAARPFLASYAISKCALVRMTETLAEEYPEFRFYAISPGALKTPMMEGFLKLDPHKIGKEYQEAKRRVEEGGEDPMKAARLACWLFENQPGHLNGKILSAVWDRYTEDQPTKALPSWWTLRRVDENLVRQLKDLFPFPQ